MVNLQQAAARDRLQYKIAWLLLLLLIFVTVFGSMIAPHGITHEFKMTYDYQIIDGKRQMVSAPFPPTGKFWLGTDHRGYDMLSLLLHGAKYTIGFALLITILRFCLALPLGMYAGTTGRGMSAINSLQMMTTAVPALLFIYPMMYSLNQVLKKDDAVQILFLMIILIGVFPLARQFSERSHHYSGKLYISAARTMGASTSRVVFKHLMPHLRPEILFAFLTDFVQVLFLIGQLAVVNLFLGGGERVMIDPDARPPLSYLLTTSGEWGALIAYGSKMMRQYPWILSSAALFMGAAILIISNFSDQLQKRLARPYVYVNKKTYKPLVENNNMLAAIAVTCLLCLSLIIWKEYEPPQMAGATITAEDIKRYKEMKAQESYLNYYAPKFKDTAALFMTNLTQNRWDSSETLIYKAPGEENAFTTPPPAYQAWLDALVSKEYFFLDIGQVAPAGNGEFSVPVKMKRADGGEEEWTLMMKIPNYIVSIKGGPGKQ
ncbi:ABC-type dipeptide/oligopeptide/nickel transport system permease subunit [Tumebacillus sp. BK434]|uniref:ABC transporter permease n=1 Tax=Tumebacillus sp. BK434 TaxID=2512169 RepID=UPI0010528D89|nr:ABC transporter permease subunit [Tumebacillus sp. BK434]TCP55866.1 ABC-type dipeptide/oligopeptide/nickel transport system permease subunit [Tumebacillus sp. BK434]